VVVDSVQTLLNAAVAEESGAMPFIVTEACIKCKFTDCVHVCPVACFYEGENMLVISQTECIDCGICVPECPVDAIVPDSEPGKEDWVALNLKYSLIWPNITERKPPMRESELYRGVNDKTALFSEQPFDPGQ
jgi:ferredoxin